MLKKHRKCRRSTRNGRCPMTTKRRRTRPDPIRNSPQTTTTMEATKNKRSGRFMDPLLEYLLPALRNAPLQATDHHLHIFFFRPHLVSFWNRRRKGISDKLQRMTARTLSPILFNPICSFSFSRTFNFSFFFVIDNPFNSFCSFNQGISDRFNASVHVLLSAISRCRTLI